MENIKEGWRKRGFVSTYEIALLNHHSNNELIELLESKDIVKRTGAATILGQRKAVDATSSLCEALQKEKALYTKIAISEALGNMGIISVKELIPLLGEIGKNQHTKLPNKPFEKWNYPLPRDIAARAIVKIGEQALAPILERITTMQMVSLSEAIDAIGYISYYNVTKIALQPMLKLLDIFKNNDLIVWKIIRCLQSFPSTDSEKKLEHFMIYHNQPAIRWEAARSLGQICNKAPDSLMLVKNDNNPFVRKMCEMARNHILKKNQKLN